VAGLFAVSRQLAAGPPHTEAFVEEVVSLSEAADLDAFTCGEGYCAYTMSSLTTAFTGSDAPEARSKADCARAVMESQNPKVTGFTWYPAPIRLRPDVTTCKFLYDGECNVFEDNYWTWHGSSWAGIATCTKSVSSVSLGWKYKFCTEHPQDYTVSKGVTSTESWAEAVNIEGSIEGFVKTNSKFSHTASYSLSTTQSQTVHLKPDKGEQHCLWQWQAAGKGGPTGSTYAYDYAEYAVTPRPDIKPQCIPGQFSLTDVNKQMCTAAKFKIS